MYVLRCGLNTIYVVTLSVCYFVSETVINFELKHVCWYQITMSRANVQTLI